MHRSATIRAAGAALIIAAAGAAQAAPEYFIVDLGIVNSGDFASQGFGVSDNGIATGRSFGNPTQAFTWTLSGGLVGLPNSTDPARAFSAGNAVNNSGTVVGSGATTAFGSSPIPLMWKNGSVIVLGDAGFGAGRANGINNLGVAVGSVGGGNDETPAIFTEELTTLITTTGPGGVLMRTAFGINDAGLIAGSGIDPNNAARNVGLVYDANTNTMTEVGLLPGTNGALAFGISQAGHVVGVSSTNQSGGTPFVWTAETGNIEIPLPANTSQASARAVNSDGWVVGTGSGAFAVPFLYDGTQTYTLADLIPAGSGWDLDGNTSSSALGISEDGTIVGTGVFNGETRAYAMILIPAPGAGVAFALAGLFAARRRR
ncbi:MAG: hypothetical protein EA378_01560 [Phycisphaerales bacterium]|nr:MAG: hypothetical protein EA378_01560 [Phycisphaerales bacterium]